MFRALIFSFRKLEIKESIKANSMNALQESRILLIGITKYYGVLKIASILDKKTRRNFSPCFIRL